VHTAYSRVTLVSGARRVDLALPGALPLADVMPQVLRYCDPAEVPESPAAWSLGRVGGPDIPLARSLRDEDVADGEVLELRAPTATVHPAYVEDVRDAVEDAVDAAGREWTQRATIGFALGAAVVAAVALLALPELRRPRDPAALALAVALTASAVPAAWWATRRDQVPMARALVAVAAAWGAAAGWLSAAYQHADAVPALGAAVLGATLATVAARLVTPLAIGQLAVLVALAVAVVPGAALVLAGGHPSSAVRVAAVGAVLVVGVLPRLSLTIGGLAGDDYRVRTFGLVSDERLAARIRQSNALLQGTILGVAAVGGGAAALLVVTGDRWDRWLAALVGLALVLRSRVFSRVPHVVPLRAVGLAVLAAQGFLVVREAWPAAGAALAVPVCAAAVVLVAAGAIRLSEVTRARVKQSLNIAEAVTVVAMTATAAGALGSYDWIGRVT
jgi:type VII secretion integral membrane protein EccD